MTPRIAIIGGGIAGLTAAWQLHRLGQPFTLFEASARLGGTVETVRRDGFIVETGPDGWVSEKPWARELAIELGLRDELTGSNDQDRVTWILQQGSLVAMPAAMRMMVPTSLAALENSPLFSDAARAAYAAEPSRAAELKQAAPDADESVASFVLRHFGPEVLARIAGPLLSGVFGGDVHTLSVRAVMPRFVELECQHGSLVAALAGKGSAGNAATIFTTLRTGVGTLIDRMTAELPPASLHLESAVAALTRTANQWLVTTATATKRFDAVLLAVPAHIARGLLTPLDPRIARLLTLEASSALLTALAFDQTFPLPKGFGFLAPPGEGSPLLAGTFVDQKFSGRTPPGCRLLRGFYGSHLAHEFAGQTDASIAARTLHDLEALLGPLPRPLFAVVRRWPQSLPQYAVGHLERMAELDTLVARHPGLTLLGNAYNGVGLPDLIREARKAAVEAIAAKATTKAP